MDLTRDSLCFMRVYDEKLLIGPIIKRRSTA
jgi:hypothetical protein